jgi:hypothetical protein
LGQTKDYKIGIYCFSTKHAALRRKTKDWLALNQDNVSEWCDLTPVYLLIVVSVNKQLFFQGTNTINIQLNVLVKYKADLIIISLTINLFSP